MPDNKTLFWSCGTIKFCPCQRKAGEDNNGTKEGVQSRLRNEQAKFRIMVLQAAQGRVKEQRESRSSRVDW